MEGKNKATTKISFDLIRDALHLPKDSKIINARYNGHSDFLEVIIEHNGLPRPPSVGRNGRLPEIVIQVTKKPTGKMVEELEYTLDWGV